MEGLAGTGNATLAGTDEAESLAVLAPVLVSIQAATAAIQWVVELEVVDTDEVQ